MNPPSPWWTTPVLRRHGYLVAVVPGDSKDEDVVAVTNVEDEATIKMPVLEGEGASKVTATIREEAADGEVVDLAGKTMTSPNEIVIRP